jgi:Zn-dependent protease
LKLLLLAIAGLKLGKLAVVLGSMLLSLVLYAQLWGWPYAAGFILLLFAHEMGHVMAARIRGLEVSAPAFIPFMGAFITMRQAPPDVETEAYVAFGGPFVGTLACFAVYFWARAEDSTLGLAVAYAGLFLNLFNLLPISPLDGGRITAVLGPRIWLLGAPLLLVLLLVQPSPVLIVIAIMAFPQVLAAWRYDPAAPENRAYYGIPDSTKFEYAALYLGLLALLGVMTYNMHDMLAAVHRGAV